MGEWWSQRALPGPSNLEDIKPDLTDDDGNPIIVDLTFIKKIKKNKGAMFISLAKAYAEKNNINLNFN